MSYFLKNKNEFVENMIIYQGIYYGVYNKNIKYDS